MDSRRCLARPTRLSAPTEEKMRKFYQIGKRGYQVVLRTKAAEDFATAVVNDIMDLTNSQESEVDGDTDNIPASPVENSTDDVLQL